MIFLDESSEMTPKQWDYLKNRVDKKLLDKRLKEIRIIKCGTCGARILTEDVLYRNCQPVCRACAKG